MTTNNAINVSAAGLVRYDGAGTFTGVTVTNHNVLIGAASNGITSVAPGTAGIPLISAGAAADPAFGTALVVGGGTGATSFNINGVVISNTTTTGALSSVTLTAGQVVIGSATTPAAATLTAGTGISIGNGNNSITISATGGGLSWVVVSGTSQTMAVNTGYTSNNAGLCTLTMPSTAAVGDTVVVTGLGAGGWAIAQNASQLIHFGSVVTTTGVSGSLASTNANDSITITCVVANTTWTTRSSMGNITYV